MMAGIGVTLRDGREMGIALGKSVDDNASNRLKISRLTETSLHGKIGEMEDGASSYANADRTGQV